MTAFWTPDQQALAPYLEAKGLAEKCLQIIAAALQPGMTETDCQLLIRDWLRAHQLFDPARPPRVRFSGRPARRRFGLNRPGRRRYRPGMSYILQCDAVLNGYAAKAALCGPEGHTQLAPLQQQVDAWRQALPEALARGETPQQVAEQFPAIRQHYRLAPITGNLPEGNRIGEGALIQGLWQWQYSLSEAGHGMAGSAFLIVDDLGARWLNEPADALGINSTNLTQ
ncbi:M24 family metallopeptidase [Alcanivorax sp. S6407]|uniref:M24 family metallopeptidase n=1 Tax=Alcanivorax sp. S6407 TaxID=2926424 RepID=UPI001FF6466B|nr:M24 family metallopeptidase [Alcanivorax sp. S6407]MCK0154838.1 M24 family metallopeptidase [Alcanivorax sp. S6407]